MITNICNVCGHSCPVESKFCNECGAAFQLVCRFCEHSNPAGSKFCNQCGGQLNLLPCPRCGAVSEVTATTCYKCHGQLWGRGSDILESQSSAIPESVRFPGRLQRVGGDTILPDSRDLSEQIPEGAPDALDSRPYSAADGNALPGKHLRRIDNAATLSEIAEIFDELSGGGPDARDAAMSSAQPARPDGIDSPRITADIDRPSTADFQPPVDNEPGQDAVQRRGRMVVGAVALAAIAGLGYYNFGQRSQSDPIQSVNAKNEQRAPDGSVDGGVVERDLAKFKTIPTQNLPSDGTGNSEKLVAGEIVVTPASSVLEIPAAPDATEAQPAHVTLEAEKSVQDVAASASEEVPTLKTPESATAIEPDPAGAAKAVTAVSVPDRAAEASTGSPQNTTESNALPIPEPADQAAGVGGQAELKRGSALSTDRESKKPDFNIAPSQEPARASATNDAKSAARNTTASANDSLTEPATPASRKPLAAGNAQKAKTKPAPAQIAAASAYPVKPNPDLAPTRLGPSEQASAGQPAPCPGSYFTALWTNCVGEVTLSDGRHYVGEFRDGLYHGRGTAKLPDGESYVGELRNGKRDGQGTATYPDGRKYAGNWKDDKAHGKGTAIYADGREYIGDFRGGRREGRGTVTYPDGRQYSGAWQNDRYSGQGTAVYPDGTKYAGEFRNGLYHGQGTFVYPDGSKYVGDFKEGRYQGRGTVTFPDKSKYVGEFKNGHYDGQGTVTYADGFKYVGEWMADMANGQGTAYFPDGRKYVGQWKDDKPNGQGTEYDRDGQATRSGVWKDGKFIGGR